MFHYGKKLITCIDQDSATFIIQITIVIFDNYRIRFVIYKEPPFNF